MRYCCIKQHDITDCDAVCLAIICKQNSYKIGITRIREVAGADKEGTNIYRELWDKKERGIENMPRCYL